MRPNVMTSLIKGSESHGISIEVSSSL